MCFEKRKIPKHLVLEDYSRQHKRRSHAWLGFAFLLLLASMLLSLAAEAKVAVGSDAGQASASGNYQSKSGNLLVQNQEGNYLSLLHLHTQVDVEINGLIAHVSLKQSFINHTRDWQEAVYLFPLPENAAVNYMEMRIGERVIVGEIKRKQEAREIYKEAKQNGQRAVLSEQHRPNLFSQRVANIPPGERVEVSITYIHTTTYEQGVFAWRFPMTLTPRYFPAGEGESESQTAKPSSQWASESALRKLDAGSALAPLSPSELALPASLEQFSAAPDTHNPVELTILLNSGFAIQPPHSLYHAIQSEKTPSGQRISLAREQANNMNRDFVLQWQAVESQLPQASVFSEEIDGEPYSLLMLLPPQQNQLQEETFARELVFVIDVSGSMAGTSLTQAKLSLQRAVAQLRPQDRFNIIAFSDNPALMTWALEAATPKQLAAASRWIEQLQVTGGTEMRPALQAAFEQFDPASPALQQIVFITDGAVGNETELFRLVQNRLGKVRLFPVGIGSAPNAWFMKKIAEFGRGSALHIGKVNEVDEQIGHLFAKLKQPASTDLRVDWPGDAEIYPARLPDLYFSEPLLIAVKSRTLPAFVDIAGSSAAGAWRQRLDIAGAIQSTPAKGISTLWARAKIEALEDRKITGGAKTELNEEITRIALSHKLLSNYTSFIAVETQPARPEQTALSRTPIQNALPHGHAAVSYPKTATNAGISGLLGLFSLSLLTLVRKGKRV